MIKSILPSSAVAVLLVGSVLGLPAAEPIAPKLPIATPLQWKSTDALIKPVSDATHEIVSVKDPTIVRYNDLWHITVGPMLVVIWTPSAFNSNPLRPRDGGNLKLAGRKTISDSVSSSWECIQCWRRIFAVDFFFIRILRPHPTHLIKNIQE